jgi:ribosomal-protein-alanine N-acetyltransferase
MTDNAQSPLYPFTEVPPRTFETERLRLRAAGTSDLDIVFKVYTGDPIATKYMFWPRSIAPEDGQPFLELVDASFAGRSNGSISFSWLIQLKETGEFIGGCGIDSLTGNTVSGGYILNPAFWGKSYAAEAWKPVVEWAKTQPDIARIEAGHHPDNPASGAVMRKVGLTFDKITDAEGKYPNLDGDSHETVVYTWVRP